MTKLPDDVEEAIDALVDAVIEVERIEQFKGMAEARVALVKKIGAIIKVRDDHTAELVEFRDNLVAALEAENKALASRLISVEADLDEASPMRTCARCGKQDRSHRMAIEEGDEWECFPCWERCNAQERAEHERSVVGQESCSARSPDAGDSSANSHVGLAHRPGHDGRETAPLSEQIESAQKGVSAWPQWMRDAASSMAPAVEEQKPTDEDFVLLRDINHGHGVIAKGCQYSTVEAMLLSRLASAKRSFEQAPAEAEQHPEWCDCSHCTPTAAERLWPDNCGNCHACLEGVNDPVTGFPVKASRMILCPKCGNKRCPKATDHRLECTDSNEPGQPGSCYPDRHKR